MIGRILGKIVALPVRVAAVPFRIIDRTVGTDAADCTPGTMLRDLGKAVERSIEEVIDP